MLSFDKNRMNCLRSITDQARGQDMTEFEGPKKLKKISLGVGAHGVIAIGISAHGVVAIGIATHGIVSIGVVSMGVFSFGLVSMGLISSGLVSMGIAAFGQQSMGLIQPPAIQQQHNHSGH